MFKVLFFVLFKYKLHTLMNDENVIGKLPLAVYLFLSIFHVLSSLHGFNLL